MAAIKKMLNDGEDVEKFKFLYSASGTIKLAQPLWETVWNSSQNIKNRTIILFIILLSTSEYISRELKSGSERYMHSHVHCIIIHNLNVYG